MSFLLLVFGRCLLLVLVCFFGLCAECLTSVVLAWNHIVLSLLVVLVVYCLCVRQMVWPCSLLHVERKVQCVSYLISSWCFLVVDSESSSFFQGVIFPGHLSAVCLDGCGIVHCFASGGNAYMV